MKYSTIAALFFMTVLGAERTAAAQGSPCDGKAPGTYCVGQMIMTCKGPGTGPATATGCGVGVDKDGVGLIGRCVSSGPNDNKATCKMEREVPAGPCAGKPPGTYCVGQMIMTCKAGSSAGTANGCSVGIDKDGVGLIGRCVSSGPNDNKATCKMEREKKKP